MNIIPQTFLEIIIDFIQEIYLKNLEFQQILGQQCEKREFSSRIFSFKLFLRVNLKFLYFFQISTFF